MILHYGCTSQTWITTEQPLIAKLNWRLRGEAVCDTSDVECLGDLTQSRTLKVNVGVETPLRALCVRDTVLL